MSEADVFYKVPLPTAERLAKIKGITLLLLLKVALQNSLLIIAFMSLLKRAYAQGLMAEFKINRGIL